MLARVKRSFANPCLARPRLANPCIASACALLLQFASGAAGAQVAKFDPGDFGKAQLPTRQSTGDAARYIEENKGAFEPINELDANDPIVALARPIGRIDVVLRDRKTGDEVGASCTGTLLSGNRVLTNHHCLPVEGAFEPVKAAITLDYVTLDGKNARRFDLDPKPAEWDSKLDYAIAKAQGDPNAAYGAAVFKPAEASPGQSLIVIHHPLGRPKVMSRFRCLALREQADNVDLRHRCDTLGGSSGSLIFNARGEIVALHKEGGLNAGDASSFNSATRIGAIIAVSHDLAAIGAAEPPPADQPQPHANSAQRPQQGATKRAHQLDTNEMNEILRR